MDINTVQSVRYAAALHQGTVSKYSSGYLFNKGNLVIELRIKGLVKKKANTNVMHCVDNFRIVLAQRAKCVNNYNHVPSSISLMLFLSDFNKTLIFPTDFRQVLKHQISLKSV